MHPFLQSLTDLFDLSRYYGTDLLAVVCTAVYTYRLANKHRDAFVWGVLGNLGFIAFNAMALSAPGIVFNILFLALNIRAWLRWKTGQPDTPEP